MKKDFILDEKKNKKFTFLTDLVLLITTISCNINYIISNMACCFGGSSDDAIADEEGFYFGCLFVDLETNVGLKIKIKSKQIAVFKVKDPNTQKTKVYAINNICSHEGSLLNKGEIEEYNGSMCVVCPAHGIYFDLKSGSSPDSDYNQKSYQIKKKGKEIWIKLK
eukprot:TRINITY_DN474_c0_g1_i1.p1 TRINITY_DN474_c0_g1~~TRINITY_DN474_c0_g1_i1.p1  ORF type:complete len:165 (+),score=19.92 TRINITY_DN474_c0_g1_i1:120-614(+)